MASQVDLVLWKTLSALPDVRRHEAGDGGVEVRLGEAAWVKPLERVSSWARTSALAREAQSGLGLGSGHANNALLRTANGYCVH
jgi:hypothetical protein